VAEMAHSHDSRAEDGSSTLCGTGYGKGSVDKALATGRLPDRKIATGRLPRTFDLACMEQALIINFVVMKK